VAVYTDITELKRRQKELKLRQKELEQDIGHSKRREEELRLAKEQAEKALAGLREAQRQLVVKEKMASLGQLTAGIAHEIKNPLNFVNNFADLSKDLLMELEEALRPGMGALDEDARTSAEELVSTLSGNLDKIGEHGRRADGIVRSMLLHSRGGSGERSVTDLNALLEESLNLAYHGARAQDMSFNIALDRDLDPAAGSVDVVPQDVTRVFLNLFGNGFYSAHQRKRAGVEPDFRPTLRVASRNLGDAVEVRVRDNGHGIPGDVRSKLFTPFFTTKPTGEGTGLGLSLSFDIVVHQHGGSLEVETQQGEFAEFIVRLPREHPRTAKRS
jgi:signal transduction histidine kinase